MTAHEKLEGNMFAYILTNAGVCQNKRASHSYKCWVKIQKPSRALAVGCIEIHLLLVTGDFWLKVCLTALSF